MAFLIPAAAEGAEAAATIGPIALRFGARAASFAGTAAKGAWNLGKGLFGRGATAANAGFAAEGVATTGADAVRAFRSGGVAAGGAGAGLAGAASGVAGAVGGGSKFFSRLKGFAKVGGEAALAASAFTSTRRRPGLLGALTSTAAKGLVLYEILQFIKELRDFIFKDKINDPAAAAVKGKVVGADPATQSALSNAMAPASPGGPGAGPGRAAAAAGATAVGLAAFGAQPTLAETSEQSATVTMMAGGRPRTLSLPPLGGATDQQTVERSGRWWDNQVKSGLAQPLKEGDSITVGSGPGARRFEMNKDGNYERRVGPPSMPLPEGREIGPQDRARALVHPAAFADAARGALGSDDGRTVVNVENHGRDSRVSLVETPAPGADGTTRAFSVVATPGGGAMTVTHGRPVESGMLLKEAAQGTNDLIRQNAPGDGRILVGDGAAAMAQRLGQVAGETDPVSAALQRQGRAGRVVQVLGDNPRVVANFDQGPQAEGRKAGIDLVNGAMTLSVMGPDGRTPAWSRELRDPSIAVGRNGSLSMGADAMRAAASFVADPLGQAKSMEGIQGKGSFTQDMAQLGGAAAWNKTRDALDSMSMQRPARAPVARGGLER